MGTITLRLVGLISLFAASLFLVNNRGASSGSREPSPAQLIRVLCRKHAAGPRIPFMTCRGGQTQVQESRAAAASLLALGPSALPEIEDALDSVEKRGLSSELAPGLGWLEYTYGRIKGPAAYERLRRISDSPSLSPYHYGTTTFIAVALGLTSYVDSHRVPSIILCRSTEPRDALDQLILAWETNDYPSFVASLGPTATAALRLMLAGKKWDDLRRDLWKPGPSTGRVAMGYHFSFSGPWSTPDETMEQDKPPVDLAQFPAPVISTRFSTSTGVDCGNRQMKFLLTRSGQFGPWRYVVNDSDLGDLLRLMSACVAE
jgi:hypothetical protein